MLLVVACTSDLGKPSWSLEMQQLAGEAGGVVPKFLKCCCQICYLKQ